MIRVPTFLLSILACSLSATAAAQTIQYRPVPKETVEKRLASYVTKNEKRGPAIRQLFEDAGCVSPKIEELPVKGLKTPNVVCTSPGSLDSVIVVGAHFDLVEAGHGVVDNWSGASLLPSLYEGFTKTQRRHTFRFVAFAGEERGMVGSRAYVREIQKNHDTVSAMVNMDTLGLGETEIWVSRADKNLVELMDLAAAATDLPVKGMNIEAVGSTDSESFREKKIPAITIHSLTQATLPLLHSPKDNIDAIRKDEYYRTYRLVLAYLAVLDLKLD
ncbi:MAG: M28 family peptidase [Bryobacteraceae bacterium]